MNKNYILILFVFMINIMNAYSIYSNEIEMTESENHYVIAKKIKEDFERLCEICKNFGILNAEFFNFFNQQIAEEFKAKVKDMSPPFAYKMPQSRAVTYSKIFGFFIMPDGVSATKNAIYNASKIPMNNNYGIAAEGPNYETFENFLALLAENNSSVSISLINFFEFHKNINSRITELLNFTKCEYLIHKVRSESSNQLLREESKIKIVDYFRNNEVGLEYELLLINNKYHLRIYYTDWIDNNATNLNKIVATILFIKKIKKMAVFNNACSPEIVANCNAGIGRAGTFITLLNVIDSYLNNQTSIDIASFIVNSRRYRPDFVFNAWQYGMIKHLIQNPQQYIDTIGSLL